MNRARFVLLALMTSACSASPASVSSVNVAADTSLLVTGVIVVDPATATTTAPQDILIENGRIARMTPAGTVAPRNDTPHLDGSGRFAIPGLIDVHAHVGEGGVGPQDDSTRARALGQFLRYGVTTIFVPGATGAGDADFPVLRDRCRTHAIACPGLYGSGSIITAPGSHPLSTIFRMPDDVASEITEARGVTVLRPGQDIAALIASKAATGVDAIKIIVEDGPPPWYPKPRLTDEQVAALSAAAHARSLPVFAHISTARLTRVAVDAGVDGIMHAPTDRLPDDLIGRMAERRTWYVPTFALFDGILTWARRQRETDPYALAGVEPSAIESLTAPAFLASAAEDEVQALNYLEHASDNLRRAVAAGVPIALGSDVNNPFVFPGYSAHEELTWMVRAGLTPAQALRAGTLGGAAFLRASEHIGKIAPGFEADIILLSRNPLERIENSRSVVAVISDGHQVANVTADPQRAGPSRPTSTVPAYVNEAQFRTAAQAIVTAFAEEVTRARGNALATPPTVEIRNRPQLIFFSDNANTITVPWWETQPDEMRAVFRTFAGGGEAEAEHLFRAFFNRFLIAHEAGHWFQSRARRRAATLYDNENMANRIAVAFWRTQPDGERLLAELEQLAARAAANLSDPTPPGEDPVAYFGANYQTLGRDPLKYGYYQFRFMADALRERSQLDWADTVAEGERK